ncbi:MAG TPA: G1 family glutamic endopeptidase [Solirubrobacteraceae bacterium]|nr:G1 family glutamic endopeptidase [Solirubrobacteraceae bacterium]
MAIGSVLLLAVALAACGSTNVIPSASPAGVRPSAAPSANPSPTPSPSPTETPSASASSTPLPTPSPTPLPPLALNHCTGKSGGSSAAANLSNQKDFAGYLAFNGRNNVTCVEASWIQPAITCAASDSKSDVVFYLAINGTDGKGTSESHLRNAKVATEAFCDTGFADYSAWMYVDQPKNGYHLAPFAISAHDQVWAQVRGSGSSFKLTLADLTSHQIMTNTGAIKGVTRDDADWSVQSPQTGCPKKCVSLPLAKFEPFKLIGAEAVIGGVLRTLDHWPHQITTMASGSLKRATVSKFGKGTFTVTWRHR